MIDRADEVDRRYGDELREHSLSLFSPKIGAVDVVNYEVYRPALTTHGILLLTDELDLLDNR